MRGFAARFRDPNRINLRKAARACIVVPGLFVAFVAAGQSAAALFAAFGSFAAVVFSDFGGPLPRRFRAYCGLAVVGAVLVAVGTGVADTVALAVAVTLVVVFVVTFAGALGGYVAAAVTSATLAFVLSVMTLGVDAALWSRELGWTTGVLVGGVTACALWPVHQRDRVRVAAATVLTEASTALAVPAAARDLGPLRAADAALAARIGVVYRPAGSITRERALVAIALATRRLRRLLELVTSAETSLEADPTPEYQQLAACVAASLAATARAVSSETTGRGEAAALVAAREAHTAALERWAAAVIPTEGAARVVDAFTATFPLRRLSLAALRAADDAELAARDRARSGHDGRRTLADAWTMLRGHCNVRSVRFRNAARAALGLALAVLVAKQASVEHAFWVVLAALSVLRSNALGTGATALQALSGAMIGFGVAALVMTTIGSDETWLWITLPVVVFLAAYTPGAVNFVVGQAGFTVFVVVLFNIMVPEGWRTGLVRVQDIAIGAGISVLVGALLWPRGARGVARRSFAELLEAGARHLSMALDVTVRDVTADVQAASTTVADARSRAVAALEDLALEHGGGHVDREGWGALLVEAQLLELAADGIVRSGSGRAEGAAACRGARTDLDAEGRTVVDGVEAIAAAVLEEGPRAVSAGGAEPATPTSLVTCLQASDGADLHGAMALLWLHEWLVLLADHATVAARPAERATV